MQEYNEFVRKTKDRLRLYNQFRITAANIQDEIDLLKKELASHASVAAPIAKYGADQSGGGTQELNGVEAAVDRRIKITAKIESKIQRLEMDRDECLLTMRQIDRALEGLGLDEAELIREKYFQGDTWDHIGEKRHYTGKWAREKGSVIIRNLAQMIFGQKAHPTRLRFVFER